MANLQSLGQFANHDSLSPWEPLDRQQSLVSLRR
jgi:hypothetical protein